MVYVKVLAVIALIASIAWFINDPGFEPGLVIITSISTLIVQFVTEKKRKKKKSSNQQAQTVSQSSVGIQAGGNVNIGNIKGNKNVK